jgi:hypothetical protein
MMICPLCQHQFDESNACKGCGIVKGCTLIKCPNCGYEFVEESKTLSLIKRIAEFLRKKRKRNG